MSEGAFDSDIKSFQSLLDTCLGALGPEVAAISHIIISALQNGGKVLICGNGGSAADSQHLAAELVSSYTMGLDRRALPAIALTTDTSILTAFANDYVFEGVFARQVEALGKPEDVLVAISTSGNSANVVAAVEQAIQKGMSSIALLGRDGGIVAGLVDRAVVVPSSNTQEIQTVHLMIEHHICTTIELAVQEGRL